MVDFDVYNVMSELVKKFVCPKCEQAGKSEIISMPESSLGRMADVQSKDLISVYCNNCRYAELYDRKIVTGIINIFGYR